MRITLTLLVVSITFLSCQENRMSKPNQIYTLGNWTTKVGNEQAFITEWQTFAQWTAQHQQGAGIGYLLQDPDHPQQFVSFGPWESPEAVKAWRERPEFKAFVLKVRELCEDFQPRTLVLVASSTN
jgi:quinol monooxygenase YgiN